MAKTPAVFLDANVFIYFLDETAKLNNATILVLQKLVNKRAELFTSHHVIEEVLFIVNKLTGAPQALATAVHKIAELPGLNFIEPDANISFAARYAALVQRTKLGVNDALLIQLMLDAGLPYLYSYDQNLLKRAKPYGILEIK